MNVVADAEPGLARAQMASGSIFTTLGVRPITGRLFSEANDGAAAQPVCVISDGYWKRRFGARTDIADKAVVIAGVPFNIIGVTEPNFFGLTTIPILTSRCRCPHSRSSNPTWILRSLCLLRPITGGCQIMGHLKPAVSRAQTAAALDVIFKPAATEVIPSRPGEPAVVLSLELGRAGRDSAGSSAVFGSALHPHGLGQSGLANRLRQCCEPAPCTGHFARQGSRFASLARRFPRASHSPVAHREHCPSAPRWCRGLSFCLFSQPPAHLSHLLHRWHDFVEC